MSILKHIVNWFKCIVFRDNAKYILCESYVCKKRGRLIHHNWGDDINYYFFEHVTKKKVMSIPMTRDNIYIPGNYYLLIGSIISFYNLTNKTIYGSGLIDPNAEIKGIPQKIYSVRGPKTRDALIQRGINCPENYGDPALLLPVFYSPPKTEKKHGSVIVNMGTDPHMNQPLKELCQSIKLEIISMTEYDNWTDIIDKIANSEFVISESLHGLIVAETYGIPNVWVEFKDHSEGWDFKFQDYFMSIGKQKTIIKLQKELNTARIIEEIKEWKKGTINYQKMLSCFPFNIVININSEFVEHAE